jgi:D-glycero-D-manno-heptose 1,7-bisphosphate phosphatase
MTSKAGKPAIFLDRDGTLNEPVGFVNHLSMFRLFPWTVDAIRLINREGYLAVVVTNQSGVARGLYTEELVDEVHGRFEKTLADAGAHLDGIYYCPHGPMQTECDCRKPKPGMLHRAQHDLDVDLARSVVIGDSYSDLELGWSVGARSALVLTGFGQGYYEHQRNGWARQPDWVAPNLYSALMDIFSDIFSEATA